MTSKHYANLLPISLVFWSQHAIAVLSYCSILYRFQENASGTTDFIPNLGKQPFLKLSRKCLTLVPENRSYKWIPVGHLSEMVLSSQKKVLFILLKNNYVYFMIQNFEAHSFICTLYWIQICFLWKIPQPLYMLRWTACSNTHFG